MNNDFQENIQDSTNKRPPIVIVNQEINDMLNEEENFKVDYYKKHNMSTTGQFFATTILSILIFSLSAWVSNVGFLEIVDFEIPMVILFTLILTALSNQGYSKISFLAYGILSCIVYSFNPSYTFFLVTAITSNLIVLFTEKIYLNKNDFRWNNDDKKSHNFFISHLLRVKYHLLLSFALFVIFILLGYFYPSVFQSIVLPTIQGMSEGVKEGTVKLETISLFTNNLYVALNIMIGGLYFSSQTMYMLIFNALVVGYTACTMNLSYFLSYTLPHGIIELTAIIIAGAAGFRITHAVITLLSGIKLDSDEKGKIFTEHVQMCCKMFFDVSIMLIVIIILLLIAAFIEANLTITIGNMIIGI